MWDFNNKLSNWMTDIAKNQWTKNGPRTLNNISPTYLRDHKIIYFL